MRIAVQAAAFDVGAELAALAGAGVGGIGCFVGVVRGGDGLVALTLEHYPGMTEAALAGMAAEAGRRWELAKCTVIHRIGRLLVGEPIVLVAAASRHRGAALAATGFLIDWLKTEAPFWKCEDFGHGGRSWVEPRIGDLEAKLNWASLK